MPKNLSDFLNSHDWDKFRRVNRWELSRKEDIINLELPALDDERYIVRFICDGYPEQAPSVFFVDREGNKMSLTAWPKGNGRFFEYIKPPPNCFICIPLTQEGLQHHPEWRDQSGGCWDSNKHDLLSLFNFIAGLLLSSNYNGRGE